MIDFLRVFLKNVKCCFGFLFVGVVVVPVVLELLEGEASVLAHHTQNSRFFVASHHVVFVCASSSQPAATAVVCVCFHWWSLQQLFHLRGGLAQDYHLRRGFGDLAICDLAAFPLFLRASQGCSLAPIAKEQTEVAHFRVLVARGACSATAVVSMK